MKKLLISAVVLLLLMLVAGSTFAQVTPIGQPPSLKLYGKTYGEWSAAWWQWALALPATAHPLFDTTTDCFAGQSGPVRFLGGKFCQGTSQAGCSSATFTANRSCTISHGTPVFFPIINGEDSYVEEPVGATEQTLRKNEKTWTDPTSNFMVVANIDGWPLQPVRICSNGNSCTPAQSPLFQFTLASEHNILAAIGENWVQDGATSWGVSDGYYVFLPSLPIGQHTIHFYGMNDGFSLEVTYHINVQ